MGVMDSSLESQDADAVEQTRRTLLVAMPLIVTMTLGYITSASTMLPVDTALFGFAGLTMFALWGLLLFRRGNVRAVAAVTAVLFGLTLFCRVISIFSSGMLDDPAQGMFRPVYAFYASLYLFTALVLPFPWSRRISVAAWLVFAGVVTAGIFPYWRENPNRPQLLTTLLYVWVGQGLFLTLLFGWARAKHVLTNSVNTLGQMTREEQQARLRSETRLHALVDQATVGIGMIGPDNCWLDANGYIAAMTGYSLEELRGLPFCSLLPEPDRAAGRQKMTTLLADETGDFHLASERQWLRKDGTLIWVSGHIRRIVSEDQNDACAAVIVSDITARKLAEEAAARIERVEQFAFQNSPMAMVVWSPDIRVMRWSPQAETMFGWTESDVLGQNPFEWGFFLDEDREATAELARSLIEGTVAQASHMQRIRRRDGSNGWYQWHHVARRNSDGQLEAVHSMSTDISELRFALDTATEREQQLTAVFDQAAVGVSLLSLDGRWQRINQRLCDITGYTEAELLATNYQRLTHPDDLSLDLERVRQLASGEIESYEIEKRFIHKLGHVVWIKVFASCVAGTATRPPLFLAIVDDISDRVLAAREVLEHRRVQNLHFENTPLAVIEWTPDLKVKRWSRRAEAMFGWTADEVIGRNPLEWRFVHDDDLEAVTETMSTLMAAGAGMADRLNRNYHRDGHVVWCHWYNSVLSDSEHRVSSVYSLVNDVSDEQIALAALRDSQARFRGVFEQAAVGIAMVDPASNWIMVNPRFCEIVGYESSELLKLSCQAITAEQDRVAEARQRAQLIAGELDHYAIEKRYRRKDGRVVWVTLYARRLEDVGAAEPRLALVIEDITERREAASRIQELNSDLERKVAERTQQLSTTTRRWAERSHDLSLLAQLMGVLPASKDVAEANRIVGRFMPKLFRRYAGAVWLESDTAGSFGRIEQWGSAKKQPNAIQVEDCWGLRRGQSLFVDDPADPLVCPHLHANLTDIEPHVCTPIVALGNIVGLIHLSWSERSDALTPPPDKALLTSVAEQIGLAIGNVRLRDELRRQATRDPLTGLSNRRHFDESLERRIAEHARNRRSFALLMIDIDHFKTFNDRFGHEAGDEVLRATGHLLQRIVRADEAVFRLGGEEFVLLVNDGSGTDIAGCAERIRSEVEKLELFWNGEKLPTITVSIGAARHPADGRQANELMRRADEAMYTAKRTGRNRVCHASAPPELPVRVAAIRGVDDEAPTASRRFGRRLADRVKEPKSTD